jgi:hypothetical protein
MWFYTETIIKDWTTPKICLLNQARIAGSQFLVLGHCCGPLISICDIVFYRVIVKETP